MINQHDNFWIPSPEFKYISNGIIWTDSIYLGKADSISNWHDTNDEPPSEEELNRQEEADYRTALAILLGQQGVG